MENPSEARIIQKLESFRAEVLGEVRGLRKEIKTDQDRLQSSLDSVRTRVAKSEAYLTLLREREEHERAQSGKLGDETRREIKALADGVDGDVKALDLRLGALERTQALWRGALLVVVPILSAGLSWVIGQIGG